MDDVLEVFAQGVMGIFAIGVAGCLVTIPIVAFKFVTVLFERDEEEGSNAENPNVKRVDSSSD